MAENPFKDETDAPNLAALDPDNCTKEEIWKAFFADLDLQVPGAADWTQQMLIKFWQNKEKISAACEAAIDRINKDPELQGITGEHALQLGASIVFEEYERLWGEKPTDNPALQTAQARLAAARDKAEEKGAITSLHGHVSSFSSDNFLNSFTAKYIFRLPDKADTKAQGTFDDNGKLNTLAVPAKDLQSLGEIHTQFLMAACEYVRQTEDDGSHTFSVYLPGAGSDLKIDARGYSQKREKQTPAMRGEARLKRMLDIADPFDRLVGKTPDGGIYRVLSFQSYDPESETVTFSAPYLFKLKEMAESERPHHSVYNKLFHGDIMTEPNKAAVELANRILNGVLIRGITPDVATGRKVKKENDNQISIFDNEEMAASGVDNKKITYRVKYSTLISECPQLHGILQEILESDSKTKWQAYNSKLKQTFEQAYRIIMEKSDAQQEYENFKLPGRYKTVRGERKYVFDIPTKSTLNSKLIVTHYGRRKPAT